jgi:glucosyl-dolichyl phosphate glucuronosyltransferase
MASREMRLDISIVLSTYNRCSQLGPALRALLEQHCPSVNYEILIVDNNSSDGTRDLVQSLVTSNPDKLQYLFEPKQGLSYGRNAGIAKARAPIVAFSDDDVRVPPNWVAQIKQEFDADPDIDFLGGKVLPRWDSPPPRWLTREHWAPLALLDYGDQPFVVDSSKRLCLIGANFAFRRRAFDKVGMFKTDFQRVKDGIGSLEDHEMLLRLWRAHRKGLYSPQIIVTSEIDTERLQKNYHRRWHAGHGRFYAVLYDEEVERSHIGRIFGVPAHFYRQALRDAIGWTRSTLRNLPDKAFSHELRLRHFAGFCGRRWREFLGLNTHRTQGESH